MATSVLSSTFLLTLLLSIGLFFFIRASVKDRTEVARFVSERPEDSLLMQLQQHFAQRAYQVATVDAASQSVTFEGMVRPSLFLAMFLTVLAGVGLLCLSLVLAVLFPQSTWYPGFLVLLAPLAGAFYWKGATRLERVTLQVASTTDRLEPGQSIVTVSAHRDELAALRRSLPLKPAE